METNETARTMRQRTIKIRRDQDEAFAEEAWRARKSFSELLREVLDCHLNQGRQKSARNAR